MIKMVILDQSKPISLIFEEKKSKIQEKKCVHKKVKSSMARSLPVENLLPQIVGSIINYLQ